MENRHDGNQADGARGPCAPCAARWRRSGVARHDSRPERGKRRGALCDRGALARDCVRRAQHHAAGRLSDPAPAGAAVRRRAADGRPGHLGGRGRAHAARDAASPSPLQHPARLSAGWRDDERRAALWPRQARPADLRAAGDGWRRARLRRETRHERCESSSPLALISSRPHLLSPSCEPRRSTLRTHRHAPLPPLGPEVGATLLCGRLRPAASASAPPSSTPPASSPQVYTTLIRVYEACDQRSEALAVLQRMRADQVAPTVLTYNALMTVCSRAADRRGMLDHFALIRSSGQRPTVATWNIILDYCANQNGAVEIEQARRHHVAPPPPRRPAAAATSPPHRSSPRRPATSPHRHFHYSPCSDTSLLTLFDHAPRLRPSLAPRSSNACAPRA